MKKSSSEPASQYFNEVLDFVEAQAQFNYSYNSQTIELEQKEDHKKITIDFQLVDKVLVRQDVDGSRFIQINFKKGTKILVTKNLVGFKPTELIGFDLSRIPRVVTTIDLQSVSKAIEDLFEAEEKPETKAEVEILKKVYQSIMVGAEDVGFKMGAEKAWFSSIMLNPTAAIA